MQGQTSSPALDAVLARIQFDGTETPETLGPDLTKLTDKDLALLCDMLAEPGTGDDTKPRMALHALALYLGRDGTPDQRATYVGVLCRSLESDRPIEVKSFLIRQLQLAGNARATKTLSACLLQDGLCEPAAQALLAIGDEAGVKALLRAATMGTPEARVAILTAIRQSDVPDALKRLAEKTKLSDFPQDDPELLVDLHMLLSATDMTGAAMHLHETMLLIRQRWTGAADGWWAQTSATSYAFEVADALAQAGQVKMATSAYRYLIESHNLPEQIHVRCAALQGLAAAAGETAVSDVLAALTDENPELRAAAMEIAVGLGGEAITDAYVRELGDASPEARVAILDVLARRGNQAALPAVLAALEDESKGVRIAAIRAAAAIGGETTLDALVTALEGDEDDERKAVADELVRLRGEAVSSDLANALEESSSRTKCALLNVLARRGAADRLDTIRKYARHEDQGVRIAAIRAVGDLADDVPSVQRLMLLLGTVQTEDEREAIEEALTDVCKRPDDNAQHITTLIDGIDKDDVPECCSLLRVLGHLGGQSASEILLVAARDSRAEVMDAALRALSDFPNPTRNVTASVLQLATDLTETRPHVLGMRAFVELLKRTDTDAADKLELYQAGLESARRVEEKRLLLAAMAEVKDARTPDVLTPYLAYDELRAETASAMVTAARGILPHGWPAARRALEKVLASEPDDGVRQQAEDAMKTVERFEGFITDWRVAGPYWVEGKAGHDILDTPFPPEQPDTQSVEWKNQPVNNGEDRFWHIDLAGTIGGDNRAAYLRTHIWSLREQPILLELGSDDGLKVWLNGEVIHNNNALRGCEPAQDHVSATLKKAWNELTLKVTNGGGGWGACARLRNQDGSAIKDVRIDANVEPNMLPRHD